MDLIGDASKARIIAFVIDNLLGGLCSVLAVGSVHADSSIVGGTTLCFTYLGYFFIFEMLWSRTPGKFMQGLVVRNIDGTPAGLKGHLIRTIARVLEANPILLGGIPAGIAIISSAKKQRIGDSLAGTVVVPRHDVAG
jgi:uncharacterized RDD family membrane protein YckC